MENYKPRIADQILKEKLSYKGAVLIEGPKWCGKTTTAEQAAKSILYMSDPRTLRQNLSLAESEPSILLKGENPRLIDEWQVAPQLWDAVRFEVDHRHAFGQFILTGSSVPADKDRILHSGTGRFSWLKMRTMSLLESGESNGQVSLKSLFSNPDKIYGESNISLEKLAYLVCRGGWPIATYLEGKSALNQARDYFDAVLYNDINRMGTGKRDPERLRRIMVSYARNQGTQIGYKTIVDDIRANEEDNIDSRTVASYINALKEMFVIEDMPAWNPNLRSKAAIRTTDTRYFIDSSIAAAALGISPDDLINDLKTFGFLFKTMAIRDLRVYAESIDGNVYHYRDKSDLECDAVIHLRDGSYGLVEIKLGGETAIESGAKSLMKLASIIDTDKMKKPSFMMILTGIGNIAYKRSDGIYVVPIGSFGI